MKCSICGEKIEPELHPTTGEVIWEHGNNADPFPGRCCNECNLKKVIPARMKRTEK